MTSQMHRTGEEESLDVTFMATFMTLLLVTQPPWESKLRKCNWRATKIQMIKLLPPRRICCHLKSPLQSHYTLCHRLRSRTGLNPCRLEGHRMARTQSPDGHATLTTLHLSSMDHPADSNKRRHHDLEPMNIPSLCSGTTTRGTLARQHRQHRIIAGSVLATTISDLPTSAAWVLSEEMTNSMLSCIDILSQNIWETTYGITSWLIWLEVASQLCLQETGSDV